MENPQGSRKGEELADALVVVGSDIIVFSVKDCRIKSTGDDALDVSRWYRKAVEASIRQLRGAANALRRMTEVRRPDNPAIVLHLPEVASRRMHYVAVAVGGDERAPVVPERHDFGVVHVLDPDTVQAMLGELDTVTDFVAYLTAKVQLLDRAHVMLEGSERDLLAIYLREGRQLPGDVRGLLLSEGLWEQVLSDPAYQRRKEAEGISYAWDKLIEEFAGHLRGGTLLGGLPAAHTERGLRVMASEKRFHRRMLGDSFISFIRKAMAGAAQSRTVQSPSGAVYVFVVCPRSCTPDVRGYLLRGYCSILRDDYPDAPAVVGIITEQPDGDWRHSFGMVVLELPITVEVREHAAEARSIGILRRQARTEFDMKEYPDE